MHDQWQSQHDIWSCKCNFFCVYRPYKESISKEMNNDDLNLHSMTNCRAGFVTVLINYKLGCAYKLCFHFISIGLGV